MVNRERKMVEVPEMSLDLTYGTLGSALETIQSYINDYGADSVVKYHQPDYCETQYLYVFIKRPENDREYNARIANEERWEKSNEEKDAAEFKRLQAKFGKVAK
jgi:hypothetical protein